MTLSVFGSNPAGVEVAGTTGQSVTTASFSPPANAVLVALITANNPSSGGDASVSTVSNTGTAMAVAWARNARKNRNAASDGGAGTDGSAEIWTATTGVSPGAITVSAGVTSATLSRLNLKVIAISDSGGTAPTIGNKNAASSSSGTPSTAVAGTTVGSYVLASCSDWSTAGAATYTGGTVAETQEYDTTNADYSVHIFRTTNTVSGGSVTMALSAPTTQNYNLVALEIVAPASGDLSVNLTSDKSTTAESAPHPNAPNLVGVIN